MYVFQCLILDNLKAIVVWLQRLTYFLSFRCVANQRLTPIYRRAIWYCLFPPNFTIAQTIYNNLINNNNNIKIQESRTAMQKTFIQTAPEMVLCLTKDKKELHLIDVKTLAIPKSYRGTDATVAPLLYTPVYQQFLAPQGTMYMANIWSIDKQQPAVNMSLAEKLTALAIDNSGDDAFIIGGSENGSIFIWQIPSGLLLRRFTAHSGKIHSVSLNNDLLICTATQTQVKLWKISDVFASKDHNQNISEVKHAGLLTLKDRIIKTMVSDTHMFVLTDRNLIVYRLHTKSNYSFEREKTFDILNGVCMTANSLFSHIYVGASINVYEFRIESSSVEYRELSIGESGEIIIEKTPKERVFNGDNKYGAVTAVTYIESLKMLVSGTEKGEVIVWNNPLASPPGEPKKARTLNLKSQILDLICVPRPSFLKVSASTNTAQSTKASRANQKIKLNAFHKYEESKDQAREKKVLEILESKEEAEFVQSQKDDVLGCFTTLMREIRDESGLLRSRIEALQNENKNLIKCNEHYYNLFAAKFE